jgi:hypothetical protein
MELDGLVLRDLSMLDCSLGKALCGSFQLRSADIL